MRKEGGDHGKPCGETAVEGGARGPHLGGDCSNRKRNQNDSRRMWALN